MSKLLRKIKGLLGLCQAKGCWKRSEFQIDIKEMNITRYLCEKHVDDLVSTGVLEPKALEMQDGTRIELSNDVN